MPWVIRSNMVPGMRGPYSWDLEQVINTPGGSILPAGVLTPAGTYTPEHGICRQLEPKHND
jgi:hypothetical protein